MRIHEAVAPRTIERFGSRDATVVPIARSRAEGASLVRIELGPGGVLGRHEAVATQVFVVVAGSGWVSGGDGTEHGVTDGNVVVWDAKEMHETALAQMA